MMKRHYVTLLAALAFFQFNAQSQTAIKLYDHDTMNLTQIHNMPFDETRMLVTSGYDGLYGDNHYYEFDQLNNQLIELTFNGVDTIRGLPTLHEDKIFFAADITGLGLELAAYDGTSIYFFDFNAGGDSHPELVTFEDELYVIANNGTATQLFKYTGGTTFQQISDVTNENVLNFVARRGFEYYYTTMHAQFGKRLSKSVDWNGNGVFIHEVVSVVSQTATIQNAEIVNGDIYVVSSAFSFQDAWHAVHKIDAGGNYILRYDETSGPFSSAHIFKYDDKLMYYRTEPGFAEVLDLTGNGTPVSDLTLNTTQNNYIAGHVVQNGQYFLYGDNFIVNGSTHIYILNLHDAMIQANLAYQTDGAFYLYEIDSVGQPSGVIEVDSYETMFTWPPPMNQYEVSTLGSSMYMNHPMVMNNGQLKFIFANNENVLSTDIYSFESELLGTSEAQVETFGVYPNPSLDGVIHVDLNQAGEIMIFSAEGKLVRSLEGTIGTNTFEINVPGVYVIHAAGAAKKIIVH